MHFAFHRDFVTIWGVPKISRLLATFFEFFTLLKYVEHSSWSFYKLTIQIGMGLLLVILLNLIFAAFAATKKIAGLGISIQILKVLLWLLS